MMRDALYSVNKRAKNYRDAERESRSYFHGRYGASSRSKKEALYKKKEELLSYLEPVCIHKEFAGYKRIRVFDYETDYSATYARKLLMGRVVWENSYMDWGNYQEVEFFDYVNDEPEYRYYLYYVCGDGTFHSPIPDSEVGQYERYLFVEVINTLETHGDEIEDLLSLQFVNKMMDMLKSGDAVYEKTLDDCPPEFVNMVPSFESLYGLTDRKLCAVLYLLEKEVCSFVREWGKSLTFDISPGEFDAFCANLYVKQKQKHKSIREDGKKRKIYFLSYPKLSCRTDNECLLKIFKSLPFLYFACDELNKIPDESERYGKLFELLVSHESPVYDSVVAFFRKCELFRLAGGRMNKELKLLYESDNTRRIINDKGVLRFE